METFEANTRFKHTGSLCIPSLEGVSNPFKDGTKTFSFDKSKLVAKKELSEHADVFAPSISTSKKLYGDRFIPVRENSSTSSMIFELPEELNNQIPTEFYSEKELNSIKYQMLLENNILGVSQTIPHPHYLQEAQENVNTEMSMGSRLLQFRGQTRQDKFNSCTSSSPLQMSFDTSLFSSFKTKRKIPEKPFKILEAPLLEDDYYLNLIDWSKSNMLSVALKGSIYLWSGMNGLVTKLCQTTSEYEEIYTGVAWDKRGDLLAMGLSGGKTEIWDPYKLKMVRDDFEPHMERIGCLAFEGSNILATGSRDSNIIVRDLRIKGVASSVMKFRGHKQEVCGLKWSPNHMQLASGGNDNKLFIWNIKKNEPEAKFSEHKAAVKALTWSPHQNGLLLSGGGSNDKTIHVWNTLTMKNIKSVYTGSQVCNLLFSKNSNEFVSTHGFSNNQVVVWKYPELSKVSVLEGHTSRVLYLTLSPDGETIVTGAGASDETLRFWCVFPPVSQNKTSNLMPSSLNLR